MAQAGFAKNPRTSRHSVKENRGLTRAKDIVHLATPLRGKPTLLQNETNAPPIYRIKSLMEFYIEDNGGDTVFEAALQKVHGVSIIFPNVSMAHEPSLIPPNQRVGFIYLFARRSTSRDVPDSLSALEHRHGHLTSGVDEEILEYKFWGINN